MKRRPSSSAKARRPSRAFDYERAFSRNIGLVTADEQLSLRDKCVAVPGCGGVGGVHAVILARMGVGKFVLADYDDFEVENFNRQFGARVSTLGESKVEVVRRDILDINPDAEVRVLPKGVQANNVGEFLQGVDVVLDGLDFFAFDARNLLYPAARERGIWVVTAAPLGLSAAMLCFDPEGMTFEKYFNFQPSDDLIRRALKFAMGLSPKATHISYMDPRAVDLEGGRGPSHVIGVTLCGGVATTSVLKLLLSKSVRAVPYFSQFDAFTGRFREGRLWFGNRGIFQQFKIWFVRKFILERRRR